jgi:hypothetical protein
MTTNSLLPCPFQPDLCKVVRSIDEQMVRCQHTDWTFPEVWNTRTPTLSQKQALLDAYNAGMTEAASICQSIERNCSSQSLHVHAELGCDRCYKAILEARNKTDGSSASEGALSPASDSNLKKGYKNLTATTKGGGDKMSEPQYDARPVCGKCGTIHDTETCPPWTKLDVASLPSPEHSSGVSRGEFLKHPVLTGESYGSTSELVASYDKRLVEAYIDQLWDMIEKEKACILSLLTWLRKQVELHDKEYQRTGESPNRIRKSASQQVIDHLRGNEKL